MDRCNELCTKDTTGYSALCEALAERDRFLRFWLKGGLFLDGVRALNRGMIRLRDRSKAPRCWWYPVPRRDWPPDWKVRHPAVVREAYKQYSEMLNRVMFTLLSVALVCALTTFASPDTLLLVEDSKINIPLTNALMPFSGFSIAVPVLLLVLTVYLHIVFGYWLDCERERKLLNQRLVRTNEPPIESIPTLFSFPDIFSQVVTFCVLYLLVPVVLAILTWKAAAIPSKPLPLMYVIGVVTCVLVFLQLRRCPPPHHPWRTPLSCIICFLIVVYVFDVTYSPDHLRRPLELVYAELPQARLSGKDMREAHACGANLQGALLDQTRLESAELTRANLEGAHLWKAHLGDAHLEEATLANAHLTRANLRGAKLKDTDLTSARPQRTDLTSARPQRTDLRTADLRGADLRGADLRGAILPDANLTGADLTGANLTGAILERATGLIQDQVDTACSNPIPQQRPTLLTPPRPCPPASLKGYP